MELLATELRLFLAGTSDRPLEPDVIIVQSKGMATWLRQRLALEQGICANVDFLYPRDFITRVFTELSAAEAPDWKGWRDASLVWKLMATLPSFLDDPAFRQVADYVGPTPASPDARLRMFQLATRLAILFDRYQNYRPDLVLDWCDTPPEAWDGRLFNALADLDPTPHLPQLASEWLAQGFGGHLPRRFPRRIALFGLATMPPLHLRLFANLAKFRGLELRFYHLSPSRNHWEHVRSKREQLKALERQGVVDAEAHASHFEEGHPLLASWAKVGRDFQALCFEEGLEVDQDDFLPGDDAAGGHLLGQIQGDIDAMIHRGDPHELKREDVDARPIVWNEELPSLRLHAADNPLRQVEALRDELLLRLDLDPTLEPRDVVVMCPDLDTFSPLIEAVFDRPLGGDNSQARPIPYRIADRSSLSENAVARAFRMFLDLMGSRFQASAVLDLLDHAPVQAAFGMDETHVEQAASWVREAPIRWGIDAAHRASFDLPPLDENTWRFGLRRLLLGTAMSEESHEMFGSILPMSGGFGLQSTPIGHFVEFCETLFEANDALSAPRSLPDWSRDLALFLARVCVTDDDDAWQLMAIQEALVVLAEQATAGGFGASVPLALMIRALESRLTQDPSPRGFLAGGTTFCQMLPMRSVPFRVVCLLGMDEGAFPRRGEHLDFDRMRSEPRKGDRSPRLDDRQLFLEALLSARDAFIVTYTGRDPRSQKERMPSVLVSELMEVVAQSFTFPGDEKESNLSRAQQALAIHHPLQSFSPENFGPGNPVPSYDDAFARGAAALCGPKEERPLFYEASPQAAVFPDASPLLLTPEAFISFFHKPVKTFLKRRFDLALGGGVAQIRDREPLQNGGLQGYALCQTLLAGLTDGRSIQSLRQHLHAAGMLAPGKLGDAQFKDALEEVQSIAHQVRSRRPREGFRAVPIDATFGGVRVRGLIGGVGVEGIVLGIPRRPSAKDRLELWVRHLLLTHVTGRPQVSWAFGRAASGSKKRPEAAWRLGATADAREHLSELADILCRGMAAPLHFFPKSSEAYFRWPDAPKKAVEAWTGNSRSQAPGEGADPSNRLIFGKELPRLGQASRPRGFPEPLDETYSFDALATRVYGPLWFDLKAEEG